MSIEKNLKILGNAGKNVAIGLGILILTAFVAIYGMNVFIDEPQYEDFCPEDAEAIAYEDSVSCENAGGKWRQAERNEIGEPIPGEIYPAGGWCDLNYYCGEEYRMLREDYSRLIFIVSIPLGIIIIALGTFVFSLSSVGIGIMLGGVYTLIYGAAGYWRYGGNWMRFIVSLIALVALVLIAYRFNRPKKKRFGFFKRK
jgi:hypothetical protein